MSVQTSAGGGPNPAAAGQSSGGQSGSGAPEGVTGRDGANNAARDSSQPGERSATGNLTTEGQNGSPPNVGLAKVLGGPGAGTVGVTGTGDSASGKPGLDADQQRGNPKPSQSNDNSFSPEWAQQLSKKTRTDLGDRLTAFKSLDDFVQAYLDAQATPGENRPPVPGKDSAPAEVQAFYESLGKPKEAAAYPFAKSDPDFAQIAFEANLTAAQADALHGAGLARLDDTRKGIQEGLFRDYQTTDAMIRKEYGEKYDEALAFMGRGLGNNPKTGELSPLAMSLIDAGLAGKPEIVQAFIELGRAYSEGTAAPGGVVKARPESIMQGRGFDYKDEY